VPDSLDHLDFMQWMRLTFILLHLDTAPPAPSLIMQPAWTSDAQHSTSSQHGPQMHSTAHPASMDLRCTAQHIQPAWTTDAQHSTSSQHGPQMHSTAHPASMDLRCTAHPSSQCAAQHNTFYAAAHGQGLVLYEAFGGMCSGLDAVLRRGWHVQPLTPAQQP
jgi:hypothetical protein